MTNDERDKMLLEMHGNLKVVVSKINDHHDTLYGNGKPGLKNDVTILRERYDQCPARKAQSNENKRLAIATAMMVLAVITTIASLAGLIMKLN